jgi:hypothetical protein
MYQENPRGAVDFLQEVPPQTGKHGPHNLKNEGIRSEVSTAFSRLCHNSQQLGNSLNLSPHIVAEGIPISAQQSETVKGSHPHFQEPSKGRDPQSCVDDDKKSSYLKLVSSVILDGFMAGDPRTFDYILRPADGSGEWHTEKDQVLTPDLVALFVSDPDQTIGLRHRYRTRLAAIDFDNHNAINWTREDPRLRRLIALAETAGAFPVLAPTPHGLHLWLALPAALPVVTCHWLLKSWLAAAAITAKVECFPSLSSGDPQCDAKERKLSNGVRLPGQAGTVRLGDPWTDPFATWSELRQGLAMATAGPEWDARLETARGMERAHKRASKDRRRFVCSKRSAPLPEWTGPGQSNQRLGALANCGWIRGSRDVDSLAAWMASAAPTCPGFSAYASANTRSRLAPWCRAWAISCVKSPPTLAAARRSSSADPGRNQRLPRENFCRLLQTVENAAREHGTAALDWSERRISEAAGIARTTLRRMRFHWHVRLLALLYRPRSVHPAVGGSDPSTKGGGGIMGLGDSPGSDPKKIHSSAIGPARSARSPDPNLSRSPSGGTDPLSLTLPVPPSSLHPWEAERRDRERRELAQWLVMAPA